MLKEAGFTLVEALVAVVLTFILATGILGMLYTFLNQIPHRMLITCLVEGAASGVSACRMGVALNSLSCGSYSISVSIQGSCSPPIGTCSTVTVTASAQDKSFSLRDTVCNF